MNAHRHNRRPHARTTSPGKPLFELLEGRQLFSRTFTLIAESVTLDPAIVAAIEQALASSTDASCTVQPSNQRLDDASRRAAGSTTDNQLQESLLDKAKTGDRSLPGGRQNVSHEDLLRSTSNGHNLQGGRNDAQRAQLGKSGFGMTAPNGPTGRYDHLYVVIGDAEDLLGGRGSSLINDLMTSVSDRTARRPIDFGYESGPQHSQSDLGSTTLSDILGIGRSGLAMDKDTDQTAATVKTVLSNVATVASAAAPGPARTVVKVFGVIGDSALAADAVADSATARDSDALRDVTNITGAAAGVIAVAATVAGDAAVAAGAGPVGMSFATGVAVGQVINLTYQTIADETIGDTVYRRSESGRSPSYTSRRNKDQPDPTSDYVPGSSSGPIPDKGGGLVDPDQDFVGTSGVFNLGQQYRAKTGQVKTPGAPDRNEVTPAPDAIPTGGSGPIPDRFGPDMGLSQPGGRA